MTRGPRSLGGLVFLTVLALAAAAPPARAGTVTDQRPFLFAFDGSDSAAGPFRAAESGEGGPSTIAVDNSTGSVYVANDDPGGGGFVCKFDPDGAAASFSATGVSCLEPSSPFTNLLGVAVDNSGRAGYQGNILVSQYENTRLNAFDPTGSSLWTLLPSFQPCDAAVDASGHPWLGQTIGSQKVWQYGDVYVPGSPPSQTGSIELLSSDTSCNFDFDVEGNLYVRYGGGIHKYVGGVGGHIGSPDPFDPAAFNVYADQSSATGHVFTLAAGDFQEYEQGGTLLGTFGADYVKATFNHAGIAYNPSLDRVYVAQKASSTDPHPVVAAFGPPTSGGVPDIVEFPAPSFGISTAHFTGKVNPRKIGASAHFEWKTSKQSWAEAALLQSCPAGALPLDENEDAVECETDELRGNTTYEARLVTVNDADHLRVVSAPQTFTTAKATEPPEIIVKPADPVGTTTATAKAEINPKGDTADWRLELQRGCTGAWTEEPWQQIAHGSSSLVPVSFDLSGLLPSERYCVRFKATNSDGTTTRPEPTDPAAEFTTEPVAPSGVEAAFVAPRLDTSVRLNGRLDPEGEALTFHFQWRRADGGETWQQLPDEADSSQAREPIVLGEELPNLSPATTYSYRFVAENPAGTLTSAEKTFTTRPSAEVAQPASCPNAVLRANRHTTYLPDCRGFELVNQPDKGNQDVLAPDKLTTSPVAGNGERALWRVEGGAPGGYLASGNVFLAKRTGASEATPSGWRSTGLAPPPAGQLGELYDVFTTNPDFSRFIAGAKSADGSSTLVRLDGAGGQEALRAVPQGLGDSAKIDLSDDGAHVVLRNPETKQAEEVGGGEPPEVLSIQPDGEPSKCGAAYFPSAGYPWMASADASRAYFEAQPNSSGCGLTVPKALYVRNRETGQTTLIDPGTTSPLHEPEMIRAAPDGRSAYFVTFSQLDSADTNSGGDVYRWDESTGESSCLTCEATSNADVYFFNEHFFKVLISGDLSHIYFESEAPLTPQAAPGQLAIYALAGGQLRFVAEDTDPGGSGTLQNAQLSADGKVLLFGTKKSSPALTADRVEAGGSSEIYRYDDSDQSLECVSCRRDGATTHAADNPQLSADGKTVAFRTAEALVPEDVNGGADVYEWRGDTQHLITDGTSDFAEVPDVIGLGTTGRDLFLRLVSPGLTGFERDGLANLYDARIDGGFEVPPPPERCSEESCQGPLEPPPPLDQPASGNESAGNVTEPPARKPCRRPRVRRHGRCLKPHKHKRRHHRRAKRGGRRR